MVLATWGAVWAGVNRRECVAVAPTAGSLFEKFSYGACSFGAEAGKTIMKRTDLFEVTGCPTYQ